MKKFKPIILLICIALLLGALAACSAKTEITVSFETNGGNSISPITGTEGSSVTLPKAEKFYYVFAGWFDENLTTQYTFNTMPAESLTLYAKWTPVTSGMISFETNGGSKIDSIIKASGESINAPNSPLKDGYLFDGWFSDTSLSSAYQFTLMPAKAITVYAKWTRDPSKALVSFLGNNKLIKSVFVSKGSTIKDIIPYISDEYDFSGWHKLSGASFDFVAETVNADISLYTEYSSKDLVINNNIVKGYNGSGKDIVLPSGITGIAAFAFADNTSIKTIDFSQNALIISESAFLNCSNLEYAYNAENITDIGSFAFANCKKLKSVNISSITTLNAYVFNNCEALSEVVLGNNLSQIGAYAFSGCRAIVALNLYDSLLSIKEYALLNCESLKEFYIPANLSELGLGALQGCNRLQNIEVSGLNDYFFADQYNNVYNKTMTTLLFYQQAGKTEKEFQIPAGVTKVESNAFLNNRNLEHIIIPKSLKDAKGILSRFENLTKITFVDLDNINSIAYLFGASNGLDNGKTNAYVPSSLKIVNFTAITKIPDYAFYGCSYLKEINGISEVLSIGKGAFAYTALSDSFFINKELESIGDCAFEGTAITKFELDAENNFFTLTENYLYGKTDKVLIKVLPHVACFDFDEEGLSDILAIASFAFEGCSLIDTLVIPDSVKLIGKKVFAGCDNLKSLTMPLDGVLNSLNGFDTLFSGNVPNMLSVEITGSITEIPDYAFSYCGIRNIRLPETVVSIGSSAFIECYNLEEISGLENVESIGSSAFYRCEKLKFIEFGNKLQTIGIEAFSNTGLTSVSIPESVIEIAMQAFYYCFDLTSLVFINPELSKLETIDYWAFTDTKLEGELILPASVEFIGSSAFSGANITKVEFVGTPSDSLEIDTWAFAACHLLEKVIFKGNVTTLGRYLFTYCEELTEITGLNSNLKSIGDFAFVRCQKLVNLELPASLIFVGQDIFRETGWFELQENGFLYNGNAAVGYKGEFSDNEIDELTLAAKYNNIDITVVCSKILQSVTTVGFHAYKINKLIIPSGYKYLSDNAFMNYINSDSYVKTVYLPATLQFIGNFAFAYNEKLLKVVIGSENEKDNCELYFIGHYAFADCTSLTAVELFKSAKNSDDIPLLAKTENAPTLFVRLSTTLAMQVTVYVPASSLSVYLLTWNQGGSYFPISSLIGV